MLLLSHQCGCLLHDEAESFSRCVLLERCEFRATAGNLPGSYLDIRVSETGLELVMYQAVSRRITDRRREILQSLNLHAGSSLDLGTDDPHRDTIGDILRLGQE